MSAELLMRTVGVLACATTLSLLTTIAAFAAVNIAPHKSDRSFCAAACIAAAKKNPDTGFRERVAKLPGRAS